MAIQICAIISLIVLSNINSGFADLNYVEHDQTMRIDLYRQEKTSKDNLAMKWLHNTSNRTNDSIPLYSYMNQEFYGKIVIGHPGQTLNVAFDTTWTYTWVLSSECSGLEDVGCYFHNKYNHRKSSEYKPDGRKFSVNLGTYNLTGYYSYDNISISHSNVSNFSFIEIVEVPKSFILNKADGIMGLGQRVDQYEPFFCALIRQKKIKKNLFSVYFNRDWRSDKAGSILLGFIDKNHTRSTKIDGEIVYDDIMYLPVDGVSYWQFNMNKIVMVYNPTKNNTYCAKGCKAIIDTSSTSITGPSKEVAEIHKNIQAKKFLLGRYSVDCKRVSGLPKIQFQIGNKTFIFSGPKYITKVLYGPMTVCLSAFQEADTSMWILGSSFLSEVYTVYDVGNKTIGLAHAAIDSSLFL